MIVEPNLHMAMLLERGWASTVKVWTTAAARAAADEVDLCGANSFCIGFGDSTGEFNSNRSVSSERKLFSLPSLGRRIRSSLCSAVSELLDAPLAPLPIERVQFAVVRSGC